MRIELLCTGDEVLTGKIVNSNFSFISQKLEEAGLDVIWGTTVGDDRERLLEAFRLASERADAVIVNGGLGPTVDDLSQEIAAKAAGSGTGAARGMACEDGGVLRPAQPDHAAEQPQAGNAACRRGDAGQSDRHGMWLCGGYRQGAVLLHAGRAARAAADAARAGHSTAAGARGAAGDDRAEAVSFVWAG